MFFAIVGVKLVAAHRTLTAETSAADTNSDRSLLRRFKGGEQDAATQLYIRYAKRLRSLAETKTASDLSARVDAEGIVQSVFRTFFRRASIGQYDIPDGEQLWKLFLVIALNKIRDTASHHRAQKRDVSKTHPIRESGGTIEGDDGEEAEALANLRMTIDELLEGMPESQRDIVTLRIEGHEVAEIARQTQRSLRSVERLLQKFRKNLGELITAE